VEVAQDPVTGSDDRRRLALDEESEGLPVAGEDGVDRPASVGVVARWPVGRGRRGSEDGLRSGCVAAPVDRPGRRPVR
jgi:hypothetical protein